MIPRPFFVETVCFIFLESQTGNPSCPIALRIIKIIAFIFESHFRACFLGNQCNRKAKLFCQSRFGDFGCNLNYGSISFSNIRQICFNTAFWNENVFSLHSWWWMDWTHMQFWFETSFQIRFLDYRFWLENQMDPSTKRRLRMLV